MGSEDLKEPQTQAVGRWEMSCSGVPSLMGMAGRITYVFCQGLPRDFSDRLTSLLNKLHLY